MYTNPICILTLIFTLALALTLTITLTLALTLTLTLTRALALTLAKVRAKADQQAKWQQPTKAPYLEPEGKQSSPSQARGRPVERQNSWERCGARASNSKPMPKPGPHLKPFELARWLAGCHRSRPPAARPTPPRRLSSRHTQRPVPSAQFPAPSTASLLPPHAKRRISTPQPPRRRVTLTSSLTQPQAHP